MKLALASAILLAAFIESSTSLRAAVLLGPVTNTANSHIYYLLEPNTWTASEAEALQLGGHLATVNDAAESLWLRDTFGEFGGADRALWIGLNDARTEGTFEWSSGDPVDFRFWRINFPNEGDGTLDFVFIDYHSSIYEGRWRNARNNQHDNPALPICGVVEIAPPGEPVLSVIRTNGQMLIHFTGALLQSDSPAGPWLELTNLISPHSVKLPSNETPGPTELASTNSLRATPLPAATTFFQARGPESIFDRTTIIPLTIEGPLQFYFEKAFAGMPDGINPPLREKPWFNGEVSLTAPAMPGLERPIEVRVRGNSSLQECPFPKLKLKIARQDRAGTPFFNAREIKVGTHCAEGGRGTIGRLRDERATLREALAYEIIAALGFTSPRVRRAQIDYRDNSPTHTVQGEAGWTIHRKALLLEDAEIIAERLGGIALDDAAIDALTNANFDLQLVTDLRLLHAFLGNWDYAISLDGENLWNFDIIALPDGTYLPMAADFDLSSFVTEEVQLTAAWDFFPELPDLEREIRWDIDLIRRDVPPAIFEAATQKFLTHRPAIESLIHTALIDDLGRTNATAHSQGFFDALSALLFNAR